MANLVSTIPYNRNTPYGNGLSWVYNNFNRYNGFLSRMNMAFKSIDKYASDSISVFENANDDDLACKYYETNDDKKITVGEVHKRFSEYKEWHLLNYLLAVNCNFENYIYKILKLAINSEPCLIDINWVHDGMIWIKNNNIPSNVNSRTESVLNGCVNGKWADRVKKIDKVLNLKTTNRPLYDDFVNAIPLLDNFKHFRVSIGHYFGREENVVRDWYEDQVPNFVSLSYRELMGWEKTIKNLVSRLDAHIMNKIVGCYQELFFYHRNKIVVDKRNLSLRAETLKDMLFNEKRGSGLYKTDFCQFIIDYYNTKI